MAKKILIGIVAFVIIIIVVSVSYVSTSSSRIEGEVRDYLKNKGYSEHDIARVEVNHSFLNMLLSYNQWNITVVFTDEPSIEYYYSIKDGKIVPGGVSGNIDDKNELKHP